MIARAYDILSVNQCRPLLSVVLIVMQMCGIIISDGQCMMTTDLEKVNTHKLMDLLPTKKENK